MKTEAMNILVDNLIVQWHNGNHSDVIDALLKRNKQELMYITARMTSKLYQTWQDLTFIAYLANNI